MNQNIDPSAFIENSNTMDEVYNNIDDYNPKRKRNILIVFDDMIADIMTNKTFQAIIKELFIRCRKLSRSLVFITQSYFSVPKEVLGHSADIDYKDVLEIYRYCTNEPYSFLTIDTTLPAGDPMRLRNNFSDSPL